MKGEFDRFSRMSDLSHQDPLSASNNPSFSSFAINKGGGVVAGEDANAAFISRLSSSELREVLQAEQFKRRHCERKVPVRLIRFSPVSAEIWCSFGAHTVMLRV